MTLDADNSAFAQSGVAIDVAGRDAQNVPIVARAVGCRVSPDRRRVTLLVPKASGTRLLDAVRSTHAVAAVFCHPRTARSVQLKGSDAVVVPVSDDDRGSVQAGIERFVADVVALGRLEAVARASVSHDITDLAGVVFTIDAAFIQTPGPTAGTKI
jgi:hypothetical protein